MSEDMTTGADLLPVLVRDDRHRDGTCLLCGKDCMRTAIVDLAYVFEVCECGNPEYAHLAERLQHRRGCPDE